MRKNDYFDKALHVHVVDTTRTHKLTWCNVPTKAPIKHAKPYLVFLKSITTNTKFQRQYMHLLWKSWFISLWTCHATSWESYIEPDEAWRRISPSCWLPAIIQFDRSKVEQQLNHLYLGRWKSLFQAVWEQKTEMIRGANGIVYVYEWQQLIFLGQNTKLKNGFNNRTLETAYKGFTEP